MTAFPGLLPASFDWNSLSKEQLAKLADLNHASQQRLGFTVDHCAGELRTFLACEMLAAAKARNSELRPDFYQLAFRFTGHAMAQWVNELEAIVKDQLAAAEAITNA